MKKLIKRIFLLVLVAAVIFLGIRFGPSLYMRLFGNGNVQWISEQFSQTLREKNELIVYEVETTGQETVTQDAWLLGTVQKVVVPYTFQMHFTVDLSNAKVMVEGNNIAVHVPSPAASYSKLIVNETEMKKNDWLYPLTPERYAQIKEKVENELFQAAKDNRDYQSNAWDVTVKNLESLFTSVVESSGEKSGCTITVVRDDHVNDPQPTDTPAING